MRTRKILIPLICVAFSIIVYFTGIQKMAVIDVNQNLIIFENTKNQKYGVMDTNGKVYHEPKYDLINYTGVYLILGKGSPNKGYDLRMSKKITQKG